MNFLQGLISSGSLRVVQNAYSLLKTLPFWKHIISNCVLTIQGQIPYTEVLKNIISWDEMLCSPAELYRPFQSNKYTATISGLNSKSSNY
jgi:hypothetical protein